MIQTVPNRRTYFNGETYAIRPACDDMLMFYAAPNGPSLGTLFFDIKSSSYAIELYLQENGYKEYNANKEETTEKTEA